MTTRYVLIKADGEALADPDTGEVFTFDTEGDARLMARPTECVARAVVLDPPTGAWKIVPLPPRPAR